MVNSNNPFVTRGTTALTSKPNREDFFFPLEQHFNTFWNQFFGDKGLIDSVKIQTGFPRMDIYEKDNTFVIQAGVTGYDPNDIGVNVANGVVTIGGSGGVDVRDETREYRLKELRTSSFSRSVKLPDNIEGDPEAVLKDGILTLTWNLKQATIQSTSKKIPIKLES